MNFKSEFRSLINQYHNYGSTPVLLPSTINYDHDETFIKMNKETKPDTYKFHLFHTTQDYVKRSPTTK